ncbi:hypothetical protein CHLNCDRAFT_58926 [Chlorella variabilis]|uniref:Uncharacterized protein n=1 Tax=Chlorella variabilis TaxID=554065 RepID=E1ZPH5_CHLVA|nr:hypothetical protein CHLNCDRAFT_58926 [Chlorella variabilis]EFN52242.1 hypothetical protein CHLNCDRAFT_58926 [Chlorella variabilis]|eukprot:XP_005844344.1 hypothetical protein CHLNCDRAFT_58926 [Chlorella variabilis]
MVADLMLFSYLNQNTAEWIVREPTITIIKMSVLPGDGNLAQLEFFNADGVNVGRGEYMLRHGYGLDGEVAPYVGDRYILDYRNSYSMAALGLRGPGVDARLRLLAVMAQTRTVDPFKGHVGKPYSIYTDGSGVKLIATMGTGGFNHRDIFIRAIHVQKGNSSAAAVLQKLGNTWLLRVTANGKHGRGLQFVKITPDILVDGNCKSVSSRESQVWNLV